MFPIRLRIYTAFRCDEDRGRKKRGSQETSLDKPTLTDKLTAISPEIDIHIIPDLYSDAVYHPIKSKEKHSMATLLRDWVVSLCILTAATVVGWAFSKVGFTEANIIAIYLHAVLLTAMVTSTRSRYILSGIGSVLVFNFFFTYPAMSLRVDVLYRQQSHS